MAGRRQLSFYCFPKYRSQRTEAELNPENGKMQHLWVKVAGLEKAKGVKEQQMPKEIALIFG